MPTIKEIEQELDAYWEMRLKRYMRGPSPEWHLFLALDDQYRMPLITQGPEQSQLALAQFSFLPYGLKYISKSFQPSKWKKRKRPREDSGDQYMEAAKLLHLAMHYDFATRCFSALYDKRIECDTSMIGDGHLIFASDPESQQFEVLNAFLSFFPSSNSPHFRLTRWLLGAETPPEVVWNIARLSRPDGESRVRTRYSPELALELSEAVGRTITTIPWEWRTRNLDGRECIFVLHALQVRALFHFIQVNYGSMLHKVVGGGLPSLTLSISIVDLTDQLSTLSGVPRDVVRDILTRFVFSSSGRTQDPALCPLLPLAGRMLYSSPSLLMHLQLERNLLTLLARHEPRDFDAASGVFESSMLGDVCGTLQEAGLEYRRSVYLPNRRSAGEIDIIVLDRRANHVLILEAKWTIQPGDPSEVRRRKEMCARKAEQLSKKLSAARQVPNDVASMFGLNAKEADFLKIDGLVIVDGYAGLPSRLTVEAVVSSRVFGAAVRRLRRISSILEFFTSGEWLPKRDIHFRSTMRSLSFGDVCVESSAVSVPYGSARYEYLVE